MQKSILCIDDDVDIAQIVKYILEKSDYKFLSAYSGEAALILLEKNIPDLILLDLMLPKIQGEDLCKQLKNDPKFSHIPIILFAASSADFKTLIKEIGADDYVIKPFQEKDLINKIQKLLG